MNSIKIYFDKNGCIYGVSGALELGLKNQVYKFTKFEDAEKWLNVGAFGDRELCSKSRAKMITSAWSVDRAIVR